MKNKESKNWHISCTSCGCEIEEVSKELKNEKGDYKCKDCGMSIFLVIGVKSREAEYVKEIRDKVKHNGIIQMSLILY